MNKRFRFFSKLLGLFSIVSVFGFGLFLLLDHKQKQNNEVSAYSNISDISLQNGNGTINRYSIKSNFTSSINSVDSLPNGNYYFDNSYCDFDIYYTGVGSYQKMDITFFVQSIHVRRSDGNIINYWGANKYYIGEGIDLGSNDGTNNIKAFSINFGPISRSNEGVMYVQLLFKLYIDTFTTERYSNTFNWTLWTNDSTLESNVQYWSKMNNEFNYFYDSLESLKVAMTSNYNDGYQSALHSNSQGIYETGYQDGYNSGYSEANDIASEQLRDTYNQGYEAGYEYGEANATSFYEDAQSHVYNNGYNAGYGEGHSVGYTEGQNSMGQDLIDNYNEGYAEGYQEGTNANGTAVTIFSGILQVALVPINFFLAIFNFEILGINLSGFIRALFTIAITIIVIKAVIGGKGASE